jgi:hypothetical protein
MTIALAQLAPIHTRTACSSTTDIDPIHDGYAAAYADKGLAGASWDTLDAITGGLSKPSKMPGHSFSISAKRCKVGAKLRKVAGSTCSKCYALKGRYVFPNVAAAMERRYQAMRVWSTYWAGAMIASIRKTGDTHFRWHDSGDLQGINHLHAIVVIAEETPNVMHWLPTREYALVREYLRQYHHFPANLIVRVSAPMIGAVASEWEHSSSVDAARTPLTAWVDCPASKQGNKCMDCRACWDKDVEVVNYKKH